MKNKSFNIANMPKYGYINRALSKISKLALVGYDSNGAQSARAFFVRTLYAFAFYGEAGGGRVRACW